MNENEFSSVKEGFKEGLRGISIASIRREIENAARRARAFAERLVKEARKRAEQGIKRAEQMTRQSADKIAREKAEREKRERAAAAAAAIAEAARKKKQQEEDYRRQQQELRAQINRLSRELGQYRGIETDFARHRSAYDSLFSEYLITRGKYHASLLESDNLRENVNTADLTSQIANDDKSSVYSELTKLYIDSTKKPIDVYNEILQQNNVLDEKIQHLKDSFTTDDQKVFYETQQLNYMLTISRILFIFYYLLCAILLFMLFIYNRNDGSSKIWKIMILLLFIVFPFIITFITNAIYVMSAFMYAMLTGNPYVANG